MNSKDGCDGATSSTICCAGAVALCTSAIVFLAYVMAQRRYCGDAKDTIKVVGPRDGTADMRRVLRLLVARDGGNRSRGLWIAIVPRH